MTKHTRPDVYLMKAGTKGISLTSPIFNDIFGADIDGAKPKMDVYTAWTKQGWFKRCVDVLANSVVAMPWAIRNASGDIVWQSGNPLPPGLMWLNLEDLLYNTAASLVLTGGAYKLKEGNARKDGTFTEVKNLKWLRPDTMTIETRPGIHGPDEFGNFTYFRRTLGGVEYYIPKEFVVHVFTNDPFVEQGPAPAIADASKVAAQILSDMDGFTSDQLRNGLIRQHVFVAENDAIPPSPEQMENWRQYIVRKLSGAKGTPPEVMQGLDTKEIGASLADLQSEALTTAQREGIAAAMGIPASLVMANAANYATAQADQVNFQTTTNIPRCKLIARAWTDQLFGEMGLSFEPMPERLEAFQSAELEKAQAIAALAPGRVFVSRRQFADLMGWEYQPEDLEELDAMESASREANQDPDRATESGVDAREVQKDISNWKKKIKKSGRDVEFSPDFLSWHEASVIRERLAEGLGIKQVFEPPFLDF